jgi:hypothetical protein
MTNDLVTRIRNVFEDTPQIMTWFDEETYVGAETRAHISGMWETLKEAADRIELLEAALRTIDNAIPKNDPTLPAICLIAGDIAEAALNGTWPAFGVMPRTALKEKKDVD